MTTPNKTLIILPTYNEVENISKMLTRLLEEVDHVDILVVDDNSPDGTHNVVRNFARHTERVQLLLRAKKEGLAQAYLAGFGWGLKNNYDTLIEMDADFSHDPGDVPKLIKTLESADVAVGCRYIKHGKTSGWSWLRTFISRGGNIYAKTLLSLPYEDLTGGFTAWKRTVLESINYQTVRSRGYAFQVELKNRAHKTGFVLKEIPIHFRNRELGKSKMSGSIVWEAAFKVLQMRYAEQ